MKDVDCKVYPTHPKCLGMNVIERFTTSLPPERFTTFTTNAYDKITTRRVNSKFPSDITTTEKDIPEIESTTIQATESKLFYNPIRRPGFSCYEGSTDSKCVQQKLVDLPTTLRPRMDFTYSNSLKATTMESKGTTYLDLETTTMRDVTSSILYKSTTRKPEVFTYPDLTMPSTFKLQDQFKTSTQRPTFCEMYPNSQRCIIKSSPKPQTTTIGDETLVEILTFKPPKIQSSFDCSSNPNDIRCRQLVILKCEPGSSYDPRCFNPKSTGAPTYLPPLATSPTRSTGKFLICVPGTNGECDGETGTVTTEREITTSKVLSSNGSNPFIKIEQNIFIIFSEIFPTQFVTRPKPNCLFGSTDSECKKVKTSILTFKPESSTTTFATKTTQSQVKCYPGMNFFFQFSFLSLLNFDTVISIRIFRNGIFFLKKPIRKSKKRAHGNHRTGL